MRKVPQSLEVDDAVVNPSSNETNSRNEPRPNTVPSQSSGIVLNIAQVVGNDGTVHADLPVMDTAADEQVDFVFEANDNPIGDAVSDAMEQDVNAEFDYDPSRSISSFGSRPVCLG